MERVEVLLISLEVTEDEIDPSWEVGRDEIGLKGLKVITRRKC